jgi:serine-type D-Ala-D-Ala carboxypeptidase (penicillin-binding protein 5/6)
MIKKMLKKISVLIFVSLVTLAFNVQAADQPAPQPAPQPTTTVTQPASATAQPTLIPTPPNIDAKAYVLMDANSGQIIAQKNMNQKLPPASLTKIMTMYLISQALQNKTITPDDKVTISKEAWKMGGSKMFIKVGSQVPINELIQGIIVASGNDACVAMSEHVAGSQDSFVGMMNAQAKALKMNSTHYTDCTGMPDDNHYTTAYDIALLTRAVINNFPQDYQWYKQKWFTHNGIRQPNRNRLLWRYQYADGVKTGHTNAAGYCLVSSAKKDGIRLISVVLGAPNDEARAKDSIHLLTYGFRFFNTHFIYQAGSTIAKLRAWFGSPKTFPAGVKKDLYLTTPVHQYQNTNIQITTQNNLHAPIKKGQTVGNIVIILKNKPILSTPLVALVDVKNGGLWRHMIDYIEYLFHKWFGSNSNVKHISISGTPK